MGSYLSEPVTQKVSTDESNDKVNCGASSMQGWRITQEDAHNCLLDFDTNTTLFAVYDGHGGHEVAQYTAQKLPDFIKNTQAYKDGDISKALVEGFLGFDGTIATREVVAVLKEIVGDKEAGEESDDEENVDNLYKEASMPIEQVIEKYTNLVNPALKNLKKDNKFPKSPYLKPKKDAEDGAQSSSSCDSNKGAGSSSSSDGVTSSSEKNCEVKSTDNKDSGTLDSEDSNKIISTSDTKESNGPIPESKVTSSDNAESKEAVTTSSTELPTKNGNTADASSKTDVTSSTPQENGEVSKKGKGKAIKSDKSPAPTRPKRNCSQLYKKILDFVDESEEDSEDEEDKTFEVQNDDSSDDDEDLSKIIEPEASDEEGEEEEEEGSSGEDGEEEDEDDETEDDEGLEFARNMKEEPGSDSGCTAVVALLKDNELYVANAGDSRCIVCRNGKAIEMSIDHKPEDDPERNRIIKAGGKVTADGRVNGGLNLSRAIGDHAYKQNTELSDREQMITALPDVKTLTLNPAEDEFMVLACDGIWNFMSSDEVVEFVRPRLKENVKLSSICEEMFDHCLAPNTLGDGTGCDNMTAIIVSFKSNILKRSASTELDTENETSSKKAKTEDVSTGCE